MDLRERILKAAEELFAKFGIRSITMDELASELGISKKTIYQHFKDKDEIVQEVASNRMNCDHEASEEIRQNSKNVIDEVLKELEMFRQHAVSLNPVLIYDLKKYHPNTWNLFQRHKQTVLYGIIKRNLEEGIGQGLYREDINVEILAKLRLQEIDIVFDQDVFPYEKFNQFEVQMVLADHFLRGIMTEKGKEIYDNYIQENLNTNEK